MLRNRNIRIYVRNKARYNPVSKEYGFLHVDIDNFAGTTIKHIKENVKKQCRNSLKLDDLFLNNEKLSDERSVAHYNLEDGTVLESSSNPFWVACLSIKQYEVEQTQKNNPNDEAIQKWTTKSFNRKKTLLSVLLNSKNEYGSQPPHFPTLNDFVVFLEHLNKKGARMNPLYTQRDLQQMHDDFVRNFVGQSSDPLGAFIEHHAVRLGIKQYGDGRALNHVNNHTDHRNVAGPAKVNKQPKQTNNNPGGRRKKTQHCEDCEEQEADVYCPQCQNGTGGQGLTLCRTCSDAIHTGATRRNHNLQDVGSAPKVSKPYTPHAFKAPFSILVALCSCMAENPPKLSMTEDEIKERAQPLTDTDLSDKQNGRYVGGFECMENCLMPKHFVQREDSANPTYALTATGHQLARKMFSFQQSVQRFFRSHDFPQIPHDPGTVCGTRKVCLIIDEQERDRGRFLQLAEEWEIDVQVRSLPAGDYIWILTPPLQGPNVKYTQRQPSLEKVLPFIVERKGWEDLNDSVRSKRFHKQIIRMLGSGIQHCFYLMEGSISSLRYKTEQQQQKLKEDLEKIFIHNGFHINYTASWYKTATWLKWFTVLLSSAVNRGLFKDKCQLYTEFSKNAGVHPKTSLIPHTDFRNTGHTVWLAEQFIDNIFRDSRGIQPVVDSVKAELPSTKDKQILIIQGLEAYSKKRHTLQNKCLEEVCLNPEDTEDLVRDKFSTSAYNMVHYDIMCYHQLKIQIFAHVYIVRTENNQDTTKVIGQMKDNNEYVGTKSGGGQVDHTMEVDTQEFIMKQAIAKSKQHSPVASTSIVRSPKQLKKKSPRKKTLDDSETNVSDDAVHNDDLQRAIELSKKSSFGNALESSYHTNFEQNQSDSLRTKDMVAYNSHETDSQDELQKAIELSKKSVVNHTLDSTDSQEEIQRALELSKNDVKNQNFAVTDSQEELQRVLELSKHEVHIPPIAMSNSQEELKEALELSKSEDPNSVNLNDSQEELQRALELSKSDILHSTSALSDFHDVHVAKQSEFEHTLNRGSFQNRQDIINCHGHNEKLVQKFGKNNKSGCSNNLNSSSIKKTVCETTGAVPSNDLLKSLQDINNLTEEEQLRLAIEQSKQEHLMLDKCDRTGKYLDKKEDVILIDSQGTDYEDSCVLCEEEGQIPQRSCDMEGEKAEVIMQQRYEDTNNKKLNGVEEENSSQQYNRQAIEGEFKYNNEKALKDSNSSVLGNDMEIQSQDTCDDNVDQVDCDHISLTKENSVKRGDENGSHSLYESYDKIPSTKTNSVEKRGSHHLCESLSSADIDKNTMPFGNILVEDSQAAFDNDDTETVNDYVPESVGLCTNDELEDIDVIPPSPEKVSHSLKRLSGEITSKHILKRSRSSNEIVTGDNILQNDEIEENFSQESQSVSLLAEFNTEDLGSNLYNNDSLSIKDNNSKACVDSELAEKNNIVWKKEKDAFLSQLSSDNSKVKVEPDEDVGSVVKLTKVKVEPSEVVDNDINLRKVKREPGSFDQFTQEEQGKENGVRNFVKLAVDTNSNDLSTFNSTFKEHNHFDKDEILQHNTVEDSKMFTERTYDLPSVSYTDDEEYARKLQEELDRELEKEERFKTDIQRRQTRFLFKEDTNHVIIPSAGQIGNSSDKSKMVDCTNDEELAKKLEEELNRGDNSSDLTEKRMLRKRKHDEENPALTEGSQDMFMSLDVVTSQRVAEEDIRSRLQREMDDLELAKRMQEEESSVVKPEDVAGKDLTGIQDKSTDEADSMLNNSNLSQSSMFEGSTQDRVERLWDKKIKAIQKSKVNLNLQLQKIRRSQNEKYSGKSGTFTREPNKHTTTANHTASSWSDHSHRTPIHSAGTSGLSTDTKHFPKNETHSPKKAWKHDGFYESHHSTRNDDVITISPPPEKKPNFSFPSSSTGSAFSSHMTGTSSQFIASPTETSFSESQSATQMSSSQISGNMSNATCGNCKQKGHNRKWVQCPNYHSFEETQRRQKLEAEARSRVEERQNRVQQTKDELEQHKTNLELIVAQIQEEKKGLDKTIKKLDKKTTKKK